MAKPKNTSRATERQGKHELHGLTATYFYKVRRNMLNRCYNPNYKNWRHYGGRGITVCDRWRNSLSDFAKDMGPRPSPKHSIDRIDNDGNYEPDNCRWATQTQQMRNVRKNIMLTFNGKTQCLPSWAAEIGIKQATLYARLFAFGYSVEKALSIPVNEANRHRARGKGYRQRRSGRWEVYVSRKYSGTFQTEEEAISCVASIRKTASFHSADGAEGDCKSGITYAGQVAGRSYAGG